MVRRLGFLGLAVQTICLVAAVAGSASAALAAAIIETIVIVRHGEKPQGGLGQLSCQGLNRALALPAVIRSSFGKPDVIFAPNPAEQKADSGKLYDYIRPLATIEPTAIAFGMPVHANIGQSRIAALRHALDAPELHASLVLVAWEHTEAVHMARALIKEHGGDPASIPDWHWADFDSIYVLRVTRDGVAEKAVFELRHEGLDGQPATCPGEAK